MRRRFYALGLAGLLSAGVWARPAAADCTTDLDCPGPTCGSPVCQWSVGVHTCVPAGTDPPGIDGECASDSDCKCRVQGATCVPGLSHCSFTLPQDAGGSGGGSSSGAGSSTGGDATSSNASCSAGEPGRSGAEGLVVFASAAGLALLRRRRA